jgi:wyosine [tRNA(Phe)-imidazoG37] synthetase (radical SAM superfamily)
MPGLRTIPLQRGIIYGPVRSRRLGLSLGVNLLPLKYKLCSFNCVYCQYGWTPSPTLAPTYQLKDLPSVKNVARALEDALQGLLEHGLPIDSISICGNGEPTLYPQLREVIEAARELRDQYMPKVNLVIFSNSSTIGNPRVREALELLDVKIMKFDAGSEDLIWQLNHPASPVYMGEMVTGLKTLSNVFLASLFVQGKVTNADPDSVDLWIDKVGEIRPFLVQVYSLDRGPADPKIEKVNVATLQWIADRLRWRTGLEVEVY